MKNKILLIFLIYGCAIGLLSFWWQGIADSVFIFNILGIMFGDKVYSLAIHYLGNPNSAQAHYTIPWIMRVRQIYIPTSIIFWGLAGYLIQLIYSKFKKT